MTRILFKLRLHHYKNTTHDPDTVILLAIDIYATRVAIDLEL